MDMIVETDLGHDPDDFFTICYLVAAGVKIRCLTVVPGDPDQLAVARFLMNVLDLKIPLGASKLNRTKPSSGGMHYAILKKHGFSLEAKPDDLGHVLVEQTFKDFPESDVFIIGPASSVGKFFKDHPDHAVARGTMQGGFLPYSLYSPVERLEKFEGKEWVPSFNPNGDRPGFMAFASANISDRKFVGKNVCHSVLYSREIHERLTPNGTTAADIFKEGMDFYLMNHGEKKFHDPMAAVCHLYPEVGVFVRGKPVKMEAGWSVMLDPNGDQVLADVNREAFWKHIVEFN